MKNRTIAIIGIVSYILTLITSIEDTEGNYLSPPTLIALSGIITIIFTIIATVRLWKKARYVSIIFLSSTIIFFVLTLVQVLIVPKGVVPAFSLVDVTGIIHFIMFVWVIIILFQRRYE